MAFNGEDILSVHADLNRELTHYGLVSAVGCFIWIASMLTVNFLAGTRPDEEVFVVISNGYFPRSNNSAFLFDEMRPRLEGQVQCPLAI